MVDIVAVRSEQKSLREAAEGMGFIFLGQKSYGLLASALLCASLPEGVPPPVGTDDPEHEHWIDVLRMLARARALLSASEEQR